MDQTFLEVKLWQYFQPCKWNKQQRPTELFYTQICVSWPSTWAHYSCVTCSATKQLHHWAIKGHSLGHTGCREWKTSSGYGKDCMWDGRGHSRCLGTEDGEDRDTFVSGDWREQDTRVRANSPCEPEPSLKPQSSALSKQLWKPLNPILLLCLICPLHTSLLALQLQQQRHQPGFSVPVLQGRNRDPGTAIPFVISPCNP